MWQCRSSHTASVFWENPKGDPNSRGEPINVLHKRGGWLPKLFGLEYGWNLVIVLALTLAIFIYLKYSKQGYEIAVVGESENTARYAGINVKKVIIRTMAPVPAPSAALQASS